MKHKTIEVISRGK